MRESLAIDLLFSSALNSCKKQGSLDTFFQPKAAVRRSPRNLAAKEKVNESTTAKVQKQNTMETYFVHKMMIDEYDVQKKKAKATLKEKKAKGNS
jgi:hypothetical protein